MADRKKELEQSSEAGKKIATTAKENKESNKKKKTEKTDKTEKNEKWYERLGNALVKNKIGTAGMVASPNTVQVAQEYEKETVPQQQEEEIQQETEVPQTEETQQEEVDNEIADATVESLDNIDEETKNELNAMSQNPMSDEEVAVDSFVSSNDINDLGRIEIDHNRRLGLIRYDENGNFVPFDLDEVRSIMGQGKYTNLILTLVSVALSSATLGLIPIINFDKLRGVTAYRDAINDMLAKGSEYYREKNLQSDVTKANLGAQISSAEAQQENPEAFTQESIGTTANVNAAAQGDTSVLIKSMENDYNKWATEQNANLTKFMATLQSELSLRNQKEMAKLLNSQEVQRETDRILYMKSQGVSMNDIAQYYKSQGGTTNFENALKIVNLVDQLGLHSAQAFSSAGEGFASVFGSLFPMGLNSDKNIKSYVSRNSSMLRKASR